MIYEVLYHGYIWSADHRMRKRYIPRCRFALCQMSRVCCKQQNCENISIKKLQYRLSNGSLIKKTRKTFRQEIRKTWCLAKLHEKVIALKLRIRREASAAKCNFKMLTIFYASLQNKYCTQSFIHYYLFSSVSAAVLQMFLLESHCTTETWIRNMILYFSIHRIL